MRDKRGMVDGMGGQHHAPVALLPVKKTGTHCTGWISPGLAWRRAEHLAPTGIRSPDRPTRSEALYRVRYPGPQGRRSFWFLRLALRVAMPTDGEFVDAVLLYYCRATWQISTKCWYINLRLRIWSRRIWENISSNLKPAIYSCIILTFVPTLQKNTATPLQRSNLPCGLEKTNDHSMWEPYKTHKHILWAKRIFFCIYKSRWHQH